MKSIMKKIGVVILVLAMPVLIISFIVSNALTFGWTIVHILTISAIALITIDVIGKKYHALKDVVSK